MEQFTQSARPEDPTNEQPVREEKKTENTD